jgi:hypothetical protein
VAQADSVDDVLGALDAIVDQARRVGSRAGYFAAIYRTMTATVQEGVTEGVFDDAARMERLLVVFARLYFDALDQLHSGGRPARSWVVAFDAAEQWRPLVLQHVLLGVNAHINLDLGIAAAATAQGAELPAMRRDYDRINEIIASLVRQVRDRIASVSPWIGLADRAGGRTQDQIVRFSIEAARTGAWRFATELAPLPRDQWPGPVAARDARVARVGTTILRPGGWPSAALLVVRLRESDDVARAIDVLMGVPAADLAAIERRVREPRASDDR